MEDVVHTLYSFVVSEGEIRQSLEPINRCVNLTFEACFEDHTFTIKREKHLEIESVLDYLHDELNTGHWSEVPIKVRRAFTAASFVKTVMLLQTSQGSNVLKQCLKALDMGLLLGAPLVLNSDLLTDCASYLSKQMNEETVKVNASEKRKCSSERTDRFENLKGTAVDVLSCPPLATFYKYFKAKIPLKLQDCITDWPALTKWPDVNYLLKIAGDRTVPIEIGSHYVDEEWRQKLMTVRDFIKNYFLGQTENVGYLAQHNLFDQIPELRNDIHIPDYCSFSDTEESEDPEINAWFGPLGTVSPLHHDPKNNILVQVFGTKQLVLYSPGDSPYLYPHEGALLSNTAQVDPYQPDVQKFPDFGKAAAFKCTLEAGEMLYIPPKWWHHVTAIDKSFSVSFWWN